MGEREVSAVTWERIVEATEMDTDLREIRQAAETGYHSDIQQFEERVAEFKSIMPMLSTVEGVIVYKGNHS